MSATTATVSASPGRRLVRAGLLTGVVDGLFSSVLATFFYGSSATDLFQYVASTLLGEAAFAGGAATALIGVAMHFGVAFAWSAVFLLLAMRLAWVQRLLARPFGVVKVALLYGPFIWVVMSAAVLPLLGQGPPTFGVRWWVQFAGHFPFVGLPIVLSIAHRTSG